MSVVGAFMVPHPPMILPEVGRGEERIIQETTAAYEKAAEEIRDLAPDTIVISSPHHILYADYFNIARGKRAEGSFARFGAGGLQISCAYDSEFIDELCRTARRENFPAGTAGERDRSLDHAAMIPLYFIQKVYTDFRVVLTGLSGLSLADHYRFGEMIRETADRLGRRTVFVASGDLSHKLKESGPYGFDAAGPVYDRRIMDVMGRGAFGELLEFDSALLDDAAECGHRSFVIMAGALDRTAVRVEALAHQDVTGVGYGVCTYHVEGPDESRSFLDQYEEALEKEIAEKRGREDVFVRLARRSLETYVRTGKRLRLPEDFPEEEQAGASEDDRRKLWHEAAGAFVSIHKEGELRGCIGTIGPTKGCIAQEIADNAVSAGTHDPRFPEIDERELDRLEYSVDILGEPEPIRSADELDPKRYGVIVSKGGRRGLLLPDLDGVDTPEKQISIAKRKAGISPHEPFVSLERFEVVRHH